MPMPIEMAIRDVWSRWGPVSSKDAPRLAGKGLYQQAVRAYGSWVRALEAAGLPWQEVASHGRWRYGRPVIRAEEVLIRIREAAIEGIPLSRPGCKKPFHDEGVYSASSRHFGGWLPALLLAGVPVERLPHQNHSPRSTVLAAKQLAERGWSNENELLLRGYYRLMQSVWLLYGDLETALRSYTDRWPWALLGKMQDFPRLRKGQVARILRWAGGAARCLDPERIRRNAVVDHWVRHEFGSLQLACQQLQLGQARLADKKPTSPSLGPGVPNMLRKAWEILGPFQPFELERLDWVTGRLVAETYSDWSLAWRDAGLPPAESAPVPDESLSEELLAACAHGPVTRQHAWRHERDLYQRATRRFGGWYRALRSAGVKLDKWNARSLEQLIATVRALSAEGENLSAPTKAPVQAIRAHGLRWREVLLLAGVPVENLPPGRPTFAETALALRQLVHRGLETCQEMLAAGFWEPVRMAWIYSGSVARLLRVNPTRASLVRPFPTLESRAVWSPELTRSQIVSAMRFAAGHTRVLPHSFGSRNPVLGKALDSHFTSLALAARAAGLKLDPKAAGPHLQESRKSGLLAAFQNMVDLHGPLTRRALAELDPKLENWLADQYEWKELIGTERPPRPLCPPRGVSPMPHPWVNDLTRRGYERVLDELTQAYQAQVCSTLKQDWPALEARLKCRFQTVWEAQLCAGIPVEARAVQWSEATCLLSLHQLAARGLETGDDVCRAGLARLEAWARARYGSFAGALERAEEIIRNYPLRPPLDPNPPSLGEEVLTEIRGYADRQGQVDPRLWPNQLRLRVYRRFGRCDLALERAGLRSARGFEPQELLSVLRERLVDGGDANVSDLRYFCLKHFGSMASAFQAAGLVYKAPRRFPREAILARLVELGASPDGVPRPLWLRKTEPGLYDAAIYRFGSWELALKEADELARAQGLRFLVQRMDAILPTEVLLDQIREHLIAHGPGSHRELAGRLTYSVKNRLKSWSIALLCAGLPVELMPASTRWRVPEVALLALHQLRARGWESPSQIRRAGYQGRLLTAQELFGSLEGALKHLDELERRYPIRPILPLPAGHRSQTEIMTAVELLERLRNLAEPDGRLVAKRAVELQKQIKRLFGDLQQAAEAAGLRVVRVHRAIDRETLLAELRSLGSSTGRVGNRDLSYAQRQACDRHFGSFSKACQAAGVRSRARGRKP